MVFDQNAQAADLIGQLYLAVPPPGQIALRFELPILDQRADPLCDAIRLNVDPAIPALMEHL
jgi:hypothetical protein